MDSYRKVHEWVAREEEVEQQLRLTIRDTGVQPGVELHVSGNTALAEVPGGARTSFAATRSHAVMIYTIWRQTCDNCMSSARCLPARCKSPG